MAETHDDRLTLARRLKDLRERRGLSNAEVVERSGLSRNTVTNAEAGRHTTDLKTLKILAEVYDMPLVRVLDMDDDLTKDVKEGADG